MTALVLLPGMMCDARLFGPQIETFCANHTLHLPPLTAHDRFADLAGEILDQAPPRFALAGLSMGGIVAMEMVRQSPDRVERLALLDTNPLAEADEAKANRERQITLATSGHLAEVMRDEMKPNYLMAGPRRTQILDLCMQMAMDLGPAAFVRQSRALQTRRDQSDTLRSVAVPTLILCGEGDIPCPVARHELMHELVPGSRLEIVAGAGHLTTLEQPDATTDALARWLED